MSAAVEIEELEDGVWQIGKLYVIHRPGLWVQYPWFVLTLHGPLRYKTREEAFGAATVEALDA